MLGSICGRIINVKDRSPTWRFVAIVTVRRCPEARRERSTGRQEMEVYIGNGVPSQFRPQAKRGKISFDVERRINERASSIGESTAQRDVNNIRTAINDDRLRK